ncbi:VanZ family protein [Bacillus sp. B15-48]|nr:VanZ family protein [Bacillus sp. B15-48]
MVFTLTENLYSLLVHKNVEFRWNSSPDFSSLFIINDIALIHTWWLLVKFGHFLGFAIFAFLLYLWMGNRLKATTISIIFAVFTEVLQLFFGRDGRLYDVLIDSMGILTALFLLNKYFSFFVSKKTLNHNS